MSVIVVFLPYIEKGIGVKSGPCAKRSMCPSLENLLK